MPLSRLKTPRKEFQLFRPINYGKRDVLVQTTEGGTSTQTLFFGPPNTAGYTTVNITESDAAGYLVGSRDVAAQSYYLLELDDATDYIIQCDFKFRRNMEIVGGRNIVWIGAHFELLELGTDFFPAGNPAIQITDGASAQDRIIHFEGFLFEGSDLGDIIALGDCPSVGMQLGNIRVSGRIGGGYGPRSTDAWGVNVGAFPPNQSHGVRMYQGIEHNHSDLWKANGDYRYLLVDRMTVETASVGFHWDHGPDSMNIVRNANVRAVQKLGDQEGHMGPETQSWTIATSRATFETTQDGFTAAVGGATLVFPYTTTPLAGTQSLQVTRTDPATHIVGAGRTFSSATDWSNAGTANALGALVRIDATTTDYPMMRIDATDNAAAIYGDDDFWYLGQGHNVPVGVNRQLVCTFPYQIVSALRKVRVVLLVDDKGAGSGSHSFVVDTIGNGNGITKPTFTGPPINWSAKWAFSHGDATEADATSGSVLFDNFWAKAHPSDFWARTGPGVGTNYTYRYFDPTLTPSNARTFAPLSFIKTDVGSNGAFGSSVKTVAAIIKLSNLTNIKSIIGAGTDPNSWVFSVEADEGLGFWNGASGVAGGSGTLNATDWWFVAMTKETGSVTPRFHFYNFTTNVWTHVNASGAIANSGTPTTGLWIGADQAGAGFGFEGQIQMLGTWNSALGDTAIEWLYRKPNWRAHTSMISLWQLDQALTSTAVRDEVGIAHQNALTGTTAGTGFTTFDVGDYVLDTPPNDATTEDFINPPPVSTGSDGTGTYYTFDATAGAKLRRYDDPSQYAKIYDGDPPTGDFVPDGLTGIDYVAGSYQNFQLVQVGQISETETAQPITVVVESGIDVALNQISETDSAQAITAKKTKAIGQISETETAQAITAKKTKAVGQISETDTSQTLTSKKVKAIGQISETDTAQTFIKIDPILVVIGQNTETDTAQAITHKKTVAIGQASETDTAQTFIKIDPILATVGQISETDTAGAITAKKTKAIGQISETDTSVAITAIDTILALIGQNTETDTAQPISAKKTKTIGQTSETDSATTLIKIDPIYQSVAQISETDTAQPISAKKTKAIAQASETDTASTFIAVDTILATIGQNTETDSAQTLTRNKSKAIGQISETDSVGTISVRKTKTLGQNEETDTAQSITARSDKSVGATEETDTAQAITWKITRLVNQTLETEIARPIIALKTKTLGLTTETDTAQTVSVSPKYRFLGIISETDTAQAINRNKTRAIGQVSETDSVGAMSHPVTISVGQDSETDTAQSITARKTKSIGQISETDTAAVLTPTYSTRVGTVVETDEANPINRKKTKTIDQITETDTSQTTTVSTARYVDLNRATETETAQAITPKKIRALGQVLEASTPQSISARKTRAIGLNTSTESAQSLSETKSHTLGQPTENDTAGAISHSKNKALGTLTEAQTARPITAIKSRALGMTTETDSVTSITVNRNRVIIVNTVAELNSAAIINKSKVKQIGLVEEADSAATMMLKAYFGTKFTREESGLGTKTTSTGFKSQGSRQAQFEGKPKGALTRASR